MPKKLREDQARLQGLLKETITLLCKNGLHFKSGFYISALIGITTDNDETFMVEVKETVGDVEDEENVDQGDGDGRARASRKRPPDGGSHSTPRKRGRASDDDDSDNYDSDDATDNDMSNVKREPGDDGGDLVFVKQEHSDYDGSAANTSQYGQQQSAYGNNSGVPDGSFDVSHDGSSTWNQSTANLDPNQMAIAAQSQSGSQQVCTRYQSLPGHLFHCMLVAISITSAEPCSLENFLSSVLCNHVVSYSEILSRSELDASRFISQVTNIEVDFIL